MARIKKIDDGFSLVELMVVVAITGILLVVAVPSWRNWVLQHQETVLVGRITHAIRYARLQAMERESEVMLCGSANQRVCDGVWNQGQLIVLRDGGRLLRVYRALPDGWSLRWRSSLGQNAALIFSPSGGTRGQQGRLVLCHRDSVTSCVAMIILRTGRLRVEKL